MFDGWLRPRRCCPVCGRQLEPPDAGYFVGAIPLLFRYSRVLWLHFEKVLRNL